MQKISPRGLAEIAAHEGIVASPYRDSAGHWTVGIGHSAAAGWPDPATERRPFTLDEIVSIFLGDIARFEERVRRAFTRPLDQAQFDAAVSFDFNTGAIDRAAWVRLFNGGQELAARDAMLNWRRPPEVLRRRRRERDLFFDRIYAGDGTASLYPADARGRVLWHEARRIDIAALIARHSPSAAPAESWWSRLGALLVRLALRLRACLSSRTGSVPEGSGQGTTRMP